MSPGHIHVHNISTQGFILLSAYILFQFTTAYHNKMVEICLWGKVKQWVRSINKINNVSNIEPINCFHLYFMLITLKCQLNASYHELVQDSISREFLHTNTHAHTHTHKLSNANFLCKPFIKKKIKHLEIMWVFLKVDLWGIHGIWLVQNFLRNINFFFFLLNCNSIYVPLLFLRALSYCLIYRICVRYI